MNIFQKTKEQLSASIDQAIQRAVENNELISVELPEYVIEIPKEQDHGDFATNVAMQLARPAKKNPRLIAETIVKHLELTYPLAEASVAGPGFINFKLVDSWLLPVLMAVQEEDELYGESNYGKGKRIQVEFVSANPTGLLHMGNARGGALGDVLAGVLNKAGYICDKEYYINDTGNQVANLGLSVEACYYEELGKDDYLLPEDGYQGDDIKETAKRLVERDGDLYLHMPRDERLAKMIDFALKEKIGGIKAGLKAFGVSYDRWFSEESLHVSGDVLKVVETLKERGYVYEKDGALWLEATRFGEEKDEVLIRANGIPTYFAADIAYHKNKFDRGYDELINIWGADHHGHVARLKGAMTALGYDGDKLCVILMQLVRLYRGGQVVKMSKRKGQLVTLEELIEEVGKDAARFFFVMRNPDSQMDFNLDLAKQESSENPVYYVQYAHARICSMLSVVGVPVPKASQVKLDLLSNPSEIELLSKIAALPEEIALAARDYAPYRLAYYAKELANAFHSFYSHCKVITDDLELRDSRLVLVDATRITLRNVLSLLGIDAPKRM